MPRSFYETDRALSEYLLFHYGMTPNLLPRGLVATEALGFPVRCVSECLDAQRLSDHARALDLGCAVGRASFELARHCASVIGIDRSKRFISAATRLRRTGSVQFDPAE